jgi:hypothetical protein
VRADERRTRFIVAERSGGLCERCGVHPANTMHHRRKRSQSGPWCPSNVIHLCGDGTTGCHGVITNTRKEFYSAGWLVHSWETWADKPVLLWQGWAVLDPDGGWTNLGFDPPSEEHVAGCSWWHSDICDMGCGVA